MAGEAPRAHKPKPLWLGAAFVAIGMAILIGLGVWQLQRLKWKEGLLAHIAALQTAAAVPVQSMLALPPAQLDFRRVFLDCPSLERTPTLRLFAIDAEGEQVSRLITACPVGTQTLLVDRGYVAADAQPAPGRERLDERVVGVLRAPTSRNFATPVNDVIHNRWYWRDHPAMAAALGAARPLPVVLMLEAPAPGPGGPRPSALPTEIPNRHLEYALTWFGLAAALAGVYVALLLRRRA